MKIEKSNIEFLGPEYWDKLCNNHYEIIKDRFNYKVSLTEKEVIDAFKSARYFEKYVQEYRSEIEKSEYKLNIKNNRTPIEISLPFSPELTVKNCVDVIKEILGISLD